MFFGSLTIAINVFLMFFFLFFYHRFQLFSMVLDHWSNDAMVSMDRCGLVGQLTTASCFWIHWRAWCSIGWRFRCIKFELLWVWQVYNIRFCIWKRNLTIWASYLRVRNYHFFCSITKQQYEENGPHCSCSSGSQKVMKARANFITSVFFVLLQQLHVVFRT